MLTRKSAHFCTFRSGVIQILAESESRDMSLEQCAQIIPPTSLNPNVLSYKYYADSELCDRWAR